MGFDGADSDQFPKEATWFHFTASLRIRLGYINRLTELLLTYFRRRKWYLLFTSNDVSTGESYLTSIHLNGMVLRKY